MLEICLVFCKSEPQYASKRYAYKKHVTRNGPRCSNARKYVRKLAGKLLIFRFQES